MKVIKSILLAFTMALILTSCFAVEHTVGSGAQGSETTSKTQWYAVWGLVPIGKEADSKQMAGGAENYTITTKHTFVDQLISVFTGIVTINRQTVEVKK